MTHLGRPTPIGPLIREHVLIEVMVDVIKEELAEPGQQKLKDPCFVSNLVDFFRTYADRCHHGKEENILFRDLGKKRLSEEHQKIMDDLVEEHVYARKTVGKLQDAAAKQTQNQPSGLAETAQVLRELTEFYPRHIEKEDKRFFYPVLEYFTQDELDAMVQEFREFDQQMIHEKYEALLRSYRR